MKKPNILWICTDQQRFDTLGRYGNPHVHTPNLDRLAGEGVLFEQAYCQSPVCTPSRASFLTGRYPRTTRCRMNGQAIPADEKLISKLLAEGGYTCGLAGKLHLSAAHPSASPLAERRIDDGFAEFHWSHHPNPDWPTDEYHHWLRGKGKRYEVRPLEGCAHVACGMEAQYHHTTWCAEKAIHFMQANVRYPRPWMFVVDIFDPHHPFDPPRSYLDRYLEKLDDIPLPSYVPGELDNKPPYQRAQHGARKNKAFAFANLDDNDHKWLRAAYWAMVDLIDSQVGRMLAALERTGQRDDTMVIFMSDHGELLGDHGMYLKGPFFYDVSVRVPLIVSMPDTVQGGRRISSFVELTDLAPTLLDAAGLPRYPGMQGRSFWRLLTDPQSGDTHRSDVYCEHYDAGYRNRGDGAQATMVRTHAHKLVAFHGEDTGELYDLEQDPGEHQNRWADPACQTIKRKLLIKLCDRMAETVDPLPPRVAPW
ncbi:MAG: sulfatase-like hydrolase/transferase [Gammaproteobacteria bacterium]